jgi:putative phosphoesterase
VDQAALNDPIMSPYVLCRLDGLQIMVAHGDGMDEMGLVKMAEGYRVDLLVRGHTHSHGIWEHGRMLVCNPGSPSLPKGDGVPSVAVLEEGRVSLLDLRDGGVISDRRLPGI